MGYRKKYVIMKAKTVNESLNESRNMFDYSKIDNIVLDGLASGDDHPDHVDAFITSADYDGVPMTDEQLDLLNADSEFVYDEVIKYIY